MVSVNLHLTNPSSRQLWTGSKTSRASSSSCSTVSALRLCQWRRSWPTWAKRTTAWRRTRSRTLWAWCKTTTRSCCPTELFSSSRQPAISAQTPQTGANTLKRTNLSPKELYFPFIKSNQCPSTTQIFSTICTKFAIFLGKTGHFTSLHSNLHLNNDKQIFFQLFF